MFYTYEIQKQIFINDRVCPNSIKQAAASSGKGVVGNSGRKMPAVVSPTDRTPTDMSKPLRSSKPHQAPQLLYLIHCALVLRQVVGLPEKIGVLWVGEL